MKNNENSLIECITSVQKAKSMYIYLYMCTVRFIKEPQLNIGITNNFRRGPFPERSGSIFSGEWYKSDEKSLDGIRQQGLYD